MSISGKADAKDVVSTVSRPTDTRQSQRHRPTGNRPNTCLKGTLLRQSIAYVSPKAFLTTT